jgi:prepilin-type N-terminal cleavage/methylation domain-containing protein
MLNKLIWIYNIDMKNKLITTSSKAFTLIEILLVTSIISLLSTVVVNESKTSRLKADDAHMKTESNELANAVNLYKNDNNGKVPVGDIQKNAGYPIVYENNTDGTGAAYQESMQKLVDSGYISEIPTSPTGESYAYYVSEDEERAMFSAELNFESSNSTNKNSCEFVQVESYDPQECIMANADSVDNYLASNYIYFSPGYNFEPQYYYSSNFKDKEDFCDAHGNSLCYGPQSDQARVDLCEGNINQTAYASDFNMAYIGSIELAQFIPIGIGGGSDITDLGSGDFELPESSCFFILSSFAVACPILEEDTPCSGSSNSDYCTCI